MFYLFSKKLELVLFCISVPDAGRPPMQRGYLRGSQQHPGQLEKKHRALA